MTPPDTDPYRPSAGDTVTLRYISMQSTGRCALSGEVLKVRPGVHGGDVRWYAIIDSYNSQRRKLVAREGVIEVKADDRQARHLWQRIGLVELGEDPPISIEGSSL